MHPATSGIAPMEMAMEVAEHAGLPLMTHLDAPPPYRSDVMPRLRKGDILTHCFRHSPTRRWRPAAPCARTCWRRANAA